VERKVICPGIVHQQVDELAEEVCLYAVVYFGDSAHRFMPRLPALLTLLMCVIRMFQVWRGRSYFQQLSVSRWTNWRKRYVCMRSFILVTVHIGLCCLLFWPFRSLFANVLAVVY